VAHEEPDVVDQHGLHQREAVAHRLEQAVRGAQHGAQLQLVGPLVAHLERQLQQLQRRQVRLEVHQQRLHVRVGAARPPLEQQPYDAAAALGERGRRRRALLHLDRPVERHLAPARLHAAHHVEPVRQLHLLARLDRRRAERSVTSSTSSTSSASPAVEVVAAAAAAELLLPLQHDRGRAEAALGLAHEHQADVGRVVGRRGARLARLAREPRRRRPPRRAGGLLVAVHCQRAHLPRRLVELVLE